MVRHDRFLIEQAGLASGLLSEEQLDHAWAELVEGSPETDLSLEEITDETLADQLVRLGMLNPWQAEQLRCGRTKFNLGPYRILDAIGHGGMGYVFKGEHEWLGRVEAIKVLPKSKTNAASIKSFRREIRALARLDHPNLVRLSFADCDGATYYLVTEFIDGADLRRVVRHAGMLGPFESALIISQAAEALGHAHKRGLVHRDVKPGNLLITTEGVTKLTDLGLAEFCTDQESPSGGKPVHIVGTADFLAPEIVVSPDKVRPISDIYSLGCTLYYSLTGKVPFPGGTTSEKLRRHLDEAPLPLRAHRDDLDPKIVELVGRMMAKRPEDRLPTAAAVLKGLEPWTRRAGPQTARLLGEYARLPAARSYANASLADTVEVQAEPETTKDRAVGSSPPAAKPEEAPAQAEAGVSDSRLMLMVGAGLALLFAVAGLMLLT